MATNRGKNLVQLANKQNGFSEVKINFENSKKSETRSENTDGDFLTPVKISSIPTDESEVFPYQSFEFGNSLTTKQDYKRLSEFCFKDLNEDLKDTGSNNDLSKSLQCDRDTTSSSVCHLANISLADVPSEEQTSTAVTSSEEQTSTAVTSSEEQTSTAVTSFNGELLEPLNLPIRKRKGKGVENWTKNKKKRERNEGKEYEYVSVVKTSEGAVNKVTKVRKGRFIRLINCKCIYKCNETLPHDDRVAVFDKYWKLGNLQAQRNFLAGLITKVNKKRMVVNAKVNRKFNIHYFLPKIDSSRVQICKSTFLATLDETGRKIRTVISKQHSGLCSPDKRVSNAKRIPADILQKIHRHIQSFPCVPSHYSRANSKRQYLEPHLSVKKMYLDFTESLSEGVKPCSLQTYRNIFNTEYNLGFHHPKKDRCDFCAKYEEFPEGTEKENMTPEYNAHVKAKNQARHKMLEDSNKSKNDKLFKCFTFDLQQVLLAPYFNIKSFYYKRKLCVYNLTIYDNGAGKGYCYVWDETIAQRGSCDIASCVVQHIEAQCSEAEHISLYSDGCGGQNKNRFIFTALLHTLRKFSNLKSIQITFLVSGHTQMVCDSVHGTIEMAKKGRKIYVPQDWLQVIEKAKVDGIQYDAVPMNQKSFIDFKAVNDQLFDIKLSSKTVDGNKVKWSKIVSCRFEKSSEDQLKIKYGYDDEEYTIVKLRKTATNTEIAQELPKLYSSILPISLAKKNDLITISNAVTFPDTARQYYQNLVVNQEKSGDGDELFPVRHDHSAHEADAEEDQETNLNSPSDLESDSNIKSGKRRAQPSKKKNAKIERVKRVISCK